MDLDDTDRRLIAVLQGDGRASVSDLAAQLGLARGTVRTRLDRLVESGAIRGFTVRLGVQPQDRIRAIMSVRLEGRMSRSVIQALKKMPELVALHTTNGVWDLVAELETGTLAALDALLREVRAIPGISNSETNILLDTIKG